jgi:hypothetical protein
MRTTLKGSLLALEGISTRLLTGVAVTGAFAFLSMTSPLLGDTVSSSQPAPCADCNLFKKDTTASFINAEFLYWLVNEGSLDYAIGMEGKAWSDSQNTYAVGDFKNASFDWSPGLRISGGYFKAPHFWDVIAQFTYLPSFGENKAHAPHETDEFLNGTWIQPDAQTSSAALPLKHAHSRIKLDYYAFDFLFSRRFHTNEHLRINLVGGLTSALFDQDWKVFYKDIENQHAKIKNSWRFEGLGLRMGLKIDWYMGWNIYLTGTASSALLSGWYKNKAYEKTNALVPDTDNSRPLHNTEYHDNRLVFNGQMMLGPSWQKAFVKNRVEVVAGYEFNIWTNMHQIYRSSASAATAAKETYINDSNVSLQGLTLRASVDF